MPSYNPPSRKITTIEQHIIDDQQSYPEATVTFTGLLYDVALAGKVIANQMNSGGAGRNSGSHGRDQRAR